MGLQTLCSPSFLGNALEQRRSSEPPSAQANLVNPRGEFTKPPSSAHGRSFKKAFPLDPALKFQCPNVGEGLEGRGALGHGWCAWLACMCMCVGVCEYPMKRLAKTRLTDKQWKAFLRSFVVWGWEWHPLHRCPQNGWSVTLGPPPKSVCFVLRSRSQLQNGKTQEDWEKWTNPIVCQFLSNSPPPFPQFSPTFWICGFFYSVFG